MYLCDVINSFEVSRVFLNAWTMSIALICSGHGLELYDPDHGLFFPSTADFLGHETILRSFESEVIAKTSLPWSLFFMTNEFTKDQDRALHKEIKTEDHSPYWKAGQKEVDGAMETNPWNGPKPPRNQRVKLKHTTT
jgi:hypothetical protein